MITLRPFPLSEQNYRDRRRALGFRVPWGGEDEGSSLPIRRSVSQWLAECPESIGSELDNRQPADWL